MIREVDVAIVGAGPAGISAALTAAQAGANVIVLDEEDAPGGHLRWSLARTRGFGGELEARRGFEIAALADQQLRRTGVEIVQAVAWGLFDGPLLGVAESESGWQLRANAVVLATGSTDIVYPFPGWELPGVMTSRAARRLANMHRVLPGRRIAILGAGDDAEATADELQMAGAEIVVRAPTAADVVAGGDSTVAWVESGGERVSADCVVIALGRQPDPELAIQAGCKIAYSDLDGVWVPRRTETLESSVSRVFVAGDAAGICTSAEASAEGAVAGAASVAASGLSDALDRLATLRSPERKHAVEGLQILETAQ